MLIADNTAEGSDTVMDELKIVHGVREKRQQYFVYNCNKLLKQHLKISGQ